VIVTRRPKYACRSCTNGVVQAPAPTRLIPGGMPTEATVAHVLGWQPLMLGTANERGVAEACLKHLPDDINHWNAAGETSMREALQLVSACRLMLCNDSGLMHIAAGMNKPTVGIFGATLPDRTSPSGKYVNILYEPAVCSPCLQRECTTLGQPCMGNILPEMVLASCLDLLNP